MAGRSPGCERGLDELDYFAPIAAGDPEPILADGQLVDMLKAVRPANLKDTGARE